MEAKSAINRIEKQIKRLGRLNDMQAEAGAIKSVPEHSDEELSRIARANEFGTETIPARSFLRGSLHRNGRYGWRYVSREAVKSVLSGKATARQAYSLIGKRMARDIREQIKTIGPPNAPATIAKKGRNEPLVDTGGLKRSISSRAVVRGRYK